MSTYTKIEIHWEHLYHPSGNHGLCDGVYETCCWCRRLADVTGHCSYQPIVASEPTLHPLCQMNSSLTTHRVDGIGNLILPWRKLQRRRLQQGCTFVRYVTNHSRERIISHSTCLSMARNISNAAEQRKWKSTYFVTTPMTTQSLPKSHWSVHIVPRCLGGHSTLDVTLLCARKTPLKLACLIWKP